jgi:hypothetical protein
MGTLVELQLAVKIQVQKGYGIKAYLILRATKLTTHRKKKK